VDVSVTLKPESKDIIDKWVPGSGAGDFVLSADIRATKPGGKPKAPKAPKTPKAMVAAAEPEVQA